MSKNKSRELKDFLVSVRRHHSPKITPAPIWVIQRAGKRIFNKKQKKHWRETSIAEEFDQRQKHANPKWGKGRIGKKKTGQSRFSRHKKRVHKKQK